MLAAASVVWKSEDLAVLNKPGNTHSLRGKDRENPNLQDWIEAHFPESKDLPESGILQRLDFETSGCLLVALHLRAYEEWKDRVRKDLRFQKTYLCASTSRPRRMKFDLYFHSRYRSSKKILVRETGTEAENGRGLIRAQQQIGQYFIWEVDLLGPGKRHQIRAAMAHLGAPLCGDLLYGGNRAKFFGLHAWQLRCDEFSAKCPVPAGWPLTEA